MNPTRLLLTLATTTLLSCTSSRVIQPVLSIVNISPSGGATGVALDVVVSVTFSSALDPESITAERVVLLNESEEAIPADVSWLPESQAVLLNPTDPLELATNYILVLDTGLTSQAGASLVTEIHSSFRTTGDAPSNQLPLADAGGNQTVSTGSQVLLNGSASIDPEGANLDYSWVLQTVPESSVAALESADTANASFLADLAGDYLVALVVSDGQDSSSAAYAQITAVDGPVDTGDTGEPEDTSEPEDTGDTGEEPDSYDGTYRGPIVVEVTEEQVLWAEDTCTGTITIEIDTNNSIPLSGSWSCTFSPSGPFYAFWPTVTGLLDGSFTSTDNVEGIMLVETTEGSWSGQFASMMSLVGSIPESRVDVDVGGVLLDIGYSGNFTANRQ